MKRKDVVKRNMARLRKVKSPDDVVLVDFETGEDYMPPHLYGCGNCVFHGEKDCLLHQFLDEEASCMNGYYILLEELT